MDDALYDNIWLKEKLLPGFQTFVESFYDSCHRLHITILRALESGFRERGMDVGLVSRCLPNVSELRLNYYPSVDIKEMRTGKINRISAHTDFGTVTLLFQDSVGGLEVEDQDNLGTYFPVEASSKTEILVNIGDSLQRLTNDFLTSVSHRVRVPIGLQEKESGIVDERYSIAYFAKVARVQSLQPLPQFVNEVNPPKYPNVTAYELNQTKLERIYGKDVGDNLGGRMLKAIFGWIPRIW
jgi:isopenicillin N synthase-like dioxygenase